MAGNSEFVEVVSRDAIRQLDELLDKLDIGTQKIKEMNTTLKIVEVPSKAKYSIQDMTKTTVALNTVLRDNEKLRQKINDITKAEALENAKLKVTLSDLNKEQKKQAQEALGMLSAYQKLDAELNSLRADAKGLAAEMFNLEQAGQQNTVQYKELSATYYLTSERVNLLDKGLKGIDTKLGQHGRKVGDYASHWNGLGHSINQITREFPAFTYSTQTGILALSNNIPMLKDEIDKLVASNKALAAQGKPTVSIFKQIVTSIFSLNTMLALGVTAATIFGDKIGAFFDRLFKGKQTIDVAKEALEKLSKTSEDYNQKVSEMAANEVKTLESLLIVARNRNTTDKERNKALDELQSRYPAYLGNLKKEDILSNNAAEAIDRLRNALLNRAKALAVQELLGENLQKQFKAEMEYQKVIQNNAGDTKIYDLEVQKISKSKEKLRLITDEEANSLNNLREAQERSKETSGKVTTQLLTAENTRINALVPLKEEEEIFKRILDQYAQYLDVVDGDTKAKELQTEATKDFLASQYELNQARLVNEAEFNKQIFENTENGYADREHSAKKYGEIILALAKLRSEEELRLLEKATAEEIRELNKRAKEGEITQANSLEVIKSLELQSAYDRELIYENYSKAVIDANNDIENSLKGVWEELEEGERALKALEFHNNNLRQQGLFFDNIDGNTTLKQFADLENKLRDIQESEDQYRIDELQGQKRILDNEIQKLSAKEKTLENNEALNEFLKEQKEIEGEILEIENKRKQAVADVYESMKQATNSYLQSISSGTLGDFGLGSLASLFDQTTYTIINDLGEIETKTGSTFNKLFDSASTMQEKFAVAFNTVTTIAQEALAFMSQNQQAYFDAQYARLEQEKDIALKFAGDNAAGQEEINRQFEEKKREIRIKEAKAAKETAIFNSIINIAQGVTAALAQGPKGIPLSIIIGVLGAAQIALIAARPLPQYAEGTANHPGGPMMVNDAKGSNYKEKVILPSGKSFIPQQRNAILDAPKGTKVLKAGSFNEELNGILSSNGIGYPTQLLNQMPNINIDSGRGLSKKDLEDALNNTIGKMPTVNQSFTKNGFRSWVRTETGAKESLNNIVKVKGL